MFFLNSRYKGSRNLQKQITKYHEINISKAVNLDKNKIAFGWFDLENLLQTGPKLELKKGAF